MTRQNHRVVYVTNYITINSYSDERLKQILGKLNKMSAELENLTNEVAETSTVVDSAITLIEGLAAQIRDLSDDPTALIALAADLDAKTNALAAAVSANTPPVE